MYNLSVCPSPVSRDSLYAQIDSSKTLAESVGDCDESVSLLIGGVEIPRAMWAHIRPKPGTLVRAVFVPQGGGNKILRSVLMIAVIIASIYFPPLAGLGPFGEAALQAGIAMGGMLLVNALVPIKPPKLSQGEQPEGLSFITGTSNQLLPFGTIPMVIGEVRFFPPFAARPYTEISGNDQYLRVLLDLGYGNLDVSNIRIGDTDISTFPEVEMEFGTAPSLFSDDYNEVSVSLSMNEDGNSFTRSTSVDTDEISIDFSMPGGLFAISSKGKTLVSSINLTIEFKLANSVDPWVSVTDPGVTMTTSSGAIRRSGSLVSISSSSRKAFSVGVRWMVASGQYDVRVTRSSSVYGPVNKQITDPGSRVGVMNWTTMRSIVHTSPSTTGTNKLAIRMKATDQLNGVVNQINMLVKQKVRRWTGTAWTVPEEQTNPAWIMHWLMTQSEAVDLFLPESRIDIDSVFAFAQHCDLEGFSCRGAVDSVTTLFDLLRDVLLTGRGSLSTTDGKYGIVWDKPISVPSQMFTPANSKEFRGNRPFLDPPHALRMKFINLEANWQVDEIIALNDGYSMLGVDAHGNASVLPEATKFETITMPYVTSATAVWKMGRNILGQGKHSQNTMSIETSIENIVCTRGDMVLVAHDVIEWGEGWGRIVGISGTTITVSSPIEVSSTLTYSVSVRKQNGGVWVGAVQPVTTGLASSFTLTSIDPGVSVGDLAVLGSSVTDTRKMVVLGVEASENLGATISLKEYSEELFTFDNNPPPTFISSITGSLVLEPPPPPLVYISSDPADSPVDDNGNTTPGIGITIINPTVPSPIFGGGLPGPIIRPR